MTPSEKLRLIQKPYLNVSEIARLLSVSRGAVYRSVKSIKKYPPFGYCTDDIIQQFRLKGAIKRWETYAKKVEA